MNYFLLLFYIMNFVSIKASDNQMSKLKKGKKVRISKPTIEGEGCYLVVNPQNYSLVTRSFSRNKGVDVNLTPEEIQMNKEVAENPEAEEIVKGETMTGQGIFGKKFDRAVKKAIGKKATKVLYDKAKDFLPVAQSGLTGALTSSAAALSTIQPELAPFLLAGTPVVAGLANDYLANPNKYQGGNKIKNMARNEVMNKLNSELGTNYDYQVNSGLQNNLANLAQAKLQQMQIEEMQNEKSSYEPYISRMMKGRGVDLSSTYQILDKIHPALRSQPYAENYQFKYTLPPAYQKLIKNGSGLYI